jgi:hypothetical protein
MRRELKDEEVARLVESHEERIEKGNIEHLLSLS